MAKERRPNGKGNQTTKAAASQKATADSGPPGDGSAGIWRNDRGELCIGSECFSVALDQERSEVRILMDKGACNDPQLADFIEDCKQIVGEGSRTVYEVINERRDR